MHQQAICKCENAWINKVERGLEYKHYLKSMLMVCKYKTIHYFIQTQLQTALSR